MSTPKSSGELTYKQKKFCEAYIVSHNATESAIKAGYSRKTAKSVGCENLTKPDVKAYIAELEGNAISQAKEGAIATLQEVLEFYTVTMRNTDESTKYRLDAADKICEYHSQRANNKDEQTQLDKLCEIIDKATK